METLLLFAYGTLKSDQPEHSLHCSPPLSIQPAKARGVLWRLREGYPILQVEPELCLLDATHDLVGDWKRAAEAANGSPPDLADAKWIEGELFEYPLEAQVLRKMDAWENFVPKQRSPYQRRAIWVKDQSGADRVAWAYVRYSPPNWAVQLSATRWTPELR